MLLTLSSELCTVQDRFKTPSKFTNRLTFPIAIDELMKGGTNYYVQLEGISIKPWPTKTVLICCNLCEYQPCGKDMVNALSMVYGEDKFTKPKVPARMGQTEEIMIEINTLGDVGVKINSVTVQLSLLSAETN